MLRLLSKQELLKLDRERISALIAQYRRTGKRVHLLTLQERIKMYQEHKAMRPEEF